MPISYLFVFVLSRTIVKSYNPCAGSGSGGEAKEARRRAEVQGQVRRQG